MKIPCVELGPVESLDKEFFVEESDMGNTASAKDDGANREHGTAGMSLRDYFAGQAMAALMHPTHAEKALTDFHGKVDEMVRHLAISAYRHADAMLKERSRG